MKFEIKTEVKIPSVGVTTHKHTQEFADDSNVFGRVIEYREYIRRLFPNCEYKLISAKQISK